MAISTGPSATRALTVTAEDHLDGRGALERAAALEIDPGVRKVFSSEVAAMSSSLGVGVGVLRDLVRTEDRPERFKRIVRGWSAKVAEAIDAGDLASADAWLRAIIVSPVHADVFSEEVMTAFSSLCRDETFAKIMIKLASDPESARAGARLLSALGEPAVDYVIEQMAVDDPILNRRILVDFLAMAAAGDNRLLVGYITDQRWYIVRNVAIALGKTGRSQAAEPLKQLLGHEDDRVRVEAIRSLSLLDRDASVAVIVESLGDSSRRVRGAAVSLLRASPSRDVVPQVLTAIESRSIGSDEARRLVTAIAGRKDPAVAPALERLATKRLAVGAARAARDAAKEALASRPRR
ncbi:HEAT repeat domain-containing protein [bacterium]|nr:HEAT repeat domain-containing protein [bacterium]